MFWLYEEELPPGVGSERFCAMHLVYIAFFLALAVCCALFFRNSDERRRRTAERVLGSLALFFGLCEYGVTALLGHFSRYSLPLHVCSLMFLFAPLHAWTDGARPGSFAARLHSFLGAVLFHPGFLGALAALLFPDWLYYPFWNYVSLSSFLAHGFVLVYGASVLVRIAEAPEGRALFRRDLKSSLLFLLIGASVMFFFDRATGTDYWFMAWPGNDSPFLGVWRRGGCGAYLAAFALTALAVTALWYALRFVFFVRAGKQAERGDSN